MIASSRHRVITAGNDASTSQVTIGLMRDEIAAAHPALLPALDRRLDAWRPPSKESDPSSDSERPTDSGPAHRSGEEVQAAILVTNDAADASDSCGECGGAWHIDADPYNPRVHKVWLLLDKGSQLARPAARQRAGLGPDQVRTLETPHVSARPRARVCHGRPVASLTGAIPVKSTCRAAGRARATPAAPR